MVRKEDVLYLQKYLEEERLKEGMRLLEKGISPQYIVGNVDFYGNIIDVNPSVLIPRFETELLVERTIFYIRKLFDSKFSDLKILDIGTGSGCIAISLKKILDCQVVGVDISDAALEVARGNARKNGVDIELLKSDLLDGVEDKFDVIVSNPPYIRKDEEIERIVYENEPHLALFAEEDGLYCYQRILKDVKRVIRKPFLIAFEIGELQGEAIRSLVYQYLKNVEVVVEKDYSKRDRFVFIRSL